MKRLKEKVRNDIKNKRLALDPSQIESESNRIVKSLISSSVLDKYSSFLLYYPFKNEVSLLSLFSTLQSLNKEIFFPKVEEDEIKPVKVNDLSVFSEGFKGVMEPSSGVFVSKDVLDVVFVPGIAFDLSCYRLGYGGGFYDRFLSTGSFLKIGVCFDFQIVKTLPVEHFDVPMDSVVTEKREIRRNEWKF